MIKYRHFIEFGAAIAVHMAFSLFSGCASTVPTRLGPGTLAQAGAPDRTILIGAATRFVNVNAGEVVRFVVQQPDGDAKSFTWRFAGVREGVDDLGKLAPAGVLGRPVTVLVGPNPRYL